MKIEGSRILITGGTGSFGHWMARKMLDMNPRSLRIFSRDEKKQDDMRRDFPDLDYWIGDVRDFERLLAAIEGIDIVFHAAALKQVPSCERVPMEAVKTNVLGADNLCRAARRQGTGLAIGLSTDKAVKPLNAMGISKALMEKILCAQNSQAGETIFCCVRYGNILGSRGSVVPLFQKQANEGRALTITHPEMTRFLLTLDDVAALIFHAIYRAIGGEIFVKKAPAAKIGLLADAVLVSMGLEPERLEKVVTGIRPGEKIHEVLVNEHEIRRASESPDFFIIHPEWRELPPGNGRPAGYEYTSANTRQIESLAEMLALLEQMGKLENYL